MFLSSHKHFKKSFYTGRVDFTSKIIQERNEVIEVISVHQTKRHEHSTGQHPTALLRQNQCGTRNTGNLLQRRFLENKWVFFTSLLHELMQKNNPGECLA